VKRESSDVSGEWSVGNVSLVVLEFTIHASRFTISFVTFTYS
jgi:hypothetical protein